MRHDGDGRIQGERGHSAEGGTGRGHGGGKPEPGADGGDTPTARRVRIRGD